MPLLTLFSAPKPFTDPHIATIQRNAIQTWLRLPDVRVILLGEEDGLAQAAGELGVKHLSSVARNASGTPLISSMFALARQHSDSPLLGIVNTDILLLPDLVDSARRVADQLERFVLLGRRWDLDVREPLEFANGWQFRLRERIRRQGQLHRPVGSDYFIFPRSCYTDIPDFAIGRAGWDNWMIYKARSSGWPVVEGTHDIIIVHQEHDYRHLPGGAPHYRLPETTENVRLAGGKVVTRFTLLDANRRLVDGYLRPFFPSVARLWRAVETFPLLRLKSTRFGWFLYLLVRPRKGFKELRKRLRKI